MYFKHVFYIDVSSLQDFVYFLYDWILEYLSFKSYKVTDVKKPQMFIHQIAAVCIVGLNRPQSCVPVSV